MTAALPPRWRERLPIRGQHATLEPLQAVPADGLREAVGEGTLSRLSIGYPWHVPRVLRSDIRHADVISRDTLVFSTIDTQRACVKRHLQVRLEANP